MTSSVRYSAQRRCVPQADGLDALDDGVDEDHDGEQLHLRGLQREGVIDVAQQAVRACSPPAMAPPVQVGEHAVDGSRSSSRCSTNSEDRDAEAARTTKWKARSTAIARTTIVSRSGRPRGGSVISRARADAARGGRRGADDGPRVAAQAAMPARAAVLAGHDAVLGAQLLGVGADELMAYQPTHQELPDRAASAHARTVPRALAQPASSPAAWRTTLTP